MKRSPRLKTPGTLTAVLADRYRKSLPLAKRYASAAWEKLSACMRRHNPICQRILNEGSYRNEQCHNASVLAHHLLGTRSRPDLFFVSSNLVCLCLQCHPDTDGTPQWAEGVDYVKTIIPERRI